MIIYTSWYTAYFTALFSLIFIVVSMVMYRRFIQWRVWGGYVWKLKYSLMGYAAYFLILIIPFLMAEIPLMKQQFGGWPYNGVYIYAPEVADIINVTTDNLMFGRLMQMLNLDGRGYSGEVCNGFSIVLLLVFILGTVKLHNLLPNKREKNADLTIYIGYALAISVWVSLLLVVRLSSNGVSLWWFLWKFLPGASSIRAVARYMLFLSFPMAVLVALVGQKCFVPQNSTGKKVILVLSIVLLFLSNVQQTGVKAHWRRTDIVAFLDKVSEPPVDCKVFFIRQSNRKAQSAMDQLDAWDIAQKYEKKTINCYISRIPADLIGVWTVDSSDYLSTVEKWVTKNNLTGVCSYDIRQQQWSVYAPDNIK